RDAQVQQPGPLDAHGDDGRVEHAGRVARHLGGEHRLRVSRGAAPRTAAPRRRAAGRRLTAVPRLSVIVLAHNAAALLPDTLAALGRSSLPRDQWELLVVDDASTDDTAAVATALGADRVIRLSGSPRGPGGARNAAAAVAAG